MAHHSVADAAGRDVPGPAQERRHAPTTFPVGVLLRPEGGDAGVGPAVVVRAVVGGVHHDGVVGDAELVELVEHPPDLLVVGDHDVVVLALTVALAQVLLGGVRAEVHGRRGPPHEERLVRGVGFVDEPQRMLGDLVVDGLHPLLRERASVDDGLATVAVGLAVEHPARPVPLLELGVLRVVGVLGFLLGVEVVEVAEELVEAVEGGEELVLVAEMVLAELARDITERLQELGDRGILLLQADVGAGHADLGEAGANGVLAGDERGAAGGAALLRVVVGERNALVADPVDVGRAIPHLPTAVVADVPPADVVSPQDQDVRLCRHEASVSSIQIFIAAVARRIIPTG